MRNDSFVSVLVLGLAIFVALALLGGGGCTDDSARNKADKALDEAREAKAMAAKSFEAANAAQAAAKQAQAAAGQAVQVGNSAISKGVIGTLLGALALLGDVLIVVYLYRKARGKVP